HFGWKAKTGYIDIADLASVFDCLRGRKYTNGGRSDNHLHIWIGGEEALRFAIALIGKVIAVNGGYEIEARKILELLLHLVNPDVLVGRGGRCRQDCEIDLAIWQMVSRKRQTHLADQII